MKTATRDFATAAPVAPRVRKVLVPTDFSDASKKALNYAVSFARQFGSEIILIHVVEPDSALALETFPPICIEELKANGEENLPRLLRLAREAGIAKTTSLTRTGVPAHEIIEAAKESDADLIVVATHGHTGWKHFCIGSTAERIARAAPCPVLVVREKEHEFV
jgi:universal stress protein A